MRSTTGYRPGHFPSLDCYLTVCHGFVNIYNVFTLPSYALGRVGLYLAYPLFLCIAHMFAHHANIELAVKIRLKIWLISIVWSSRLVVWSVWVAIARSWWMQCYRSSTAMPNGWGGLSPISPPELSRLPADNIAGACLFGKRLGWIRPLCVVVTVLKFSSGVWTSNQKCRDLR